MSSDKHTDRHAHIPAERVAVYDKAHDDQYVHYSHEMPVETKEASGRFVLRVVPLLYGVLLGGLSDNLALGITIGAAASIVLDLRMGGDSIFRPIAARLQLLSCPYVAALAHAISRRLVAAGRQVPSMLRDMHCSAS